MEFDLNEKLKSVSLMACLVPNSIGAKTMKIEVSKDKGVNWVSYGDAFILSSTNMASYNSTIDIESPVRLRIVGVGPAQAYLDNVIVKYDTTYVVIREEEIKIRLRERLKRITIPDAKYSWSSTDYIPTGILTFKVDEYPEKEFYDNNKQ